MTNRVLVLAGLLATAASAASAADGSNWNSAFQNGIMEYLTGTWDAPTGGALALSCRSDGRVSIMAQIDGKPPPANSVLLLTTSSRAGTHEQRFPTDARGSVEMPVAGSAPLAQLWANLRRDDIVTVRYVDDRFKVLSLDGAGKTLPAKPCGE